MEHRDTAGAVIGSYFLTVPEGGEAEIKVRVSVRASFRPCYMWKGKEGCSGSEMASITTTRAPHALSISLGSCPSTLQPQQSHCSVNSVVNKHLHCHGLCDHPRGKQLVNFIGYL